MRKKWLIIACLVALVGGVYAVIYLTGKGKNQDKNNTAKTMTDAEMEELSQPTDYYAPGIDEVKNKNIDPDQRYSELMGYGYSKELVRKYDQAIVYYKSATEEDVAEEKVQEAQYKLYQLALITNDEGLANKYFELLGEEFLDKKQGSSEVRDD